MTHPKSTKEKAKREYDKKKVKSHTTHKKLYKNLEALAMNDLRSIFIIFSLRHPHLLERRQRRQD